MTKPGPKPVAADPEKWVLTEEEAQQLYDLLTTRLCLPPAVAKKTVYSMMQPKQVWVYVEQLRKKVLVDFPDLKAHLKMIELLLPHFAPPVQKETRKELTVRHVHELHALSDEELAEIVDGQVVELHPELPPAA